MKKSLLFLIGFLFPMILLAQGPRYHGIFAGDIGQSTNYTSFTNSLYVSQFGSDLTFHYGDPHSPAQTLSAAIGAVQSAFPNGGYIFLSGSEIYTNTPLSSGNGTTTIISNNFVIYGNGAQIWSYSNSHAFNIAPNAGNTIVINDVLFSTTNNANNAANKQGYCILITANTNSSVILNRCALEGTIDSVFTSGTVQSGVFHCEFNDINHWLGGWDLFVDALTSGNPTNVVYDFNYVHIHTDPQLLNVWGNNRQSVDNPTAVSRPIHSTSVSTFNFNHCVLEAINGTNNQGAFQADGSTVTVGNFKQCYFDCTTPAAAGQTILVGSAGVSLNVYGCYFTNYAAIATNGANVYINNGDYSGGSVFLSGFLSAKTNIASGSTIPNPLISGTTYVNGNYRALLTVNPQMVTATASQSLAWLTNLTSGECLIWTNINPFAGVWTNGCPGTMFLNPNDSVQFTNLSKGATNAVLNSSFIHVQ